MKIILTNMMIIFLILSGCLAGNQIVKEIYERRENYIAAHPELTEKQKDEMRNGRLWIGMSDSAAIACWGYPTNINRTISDHGSHEQWVYDRTIRTGYSTIYQKPYYLYFEDGILTDYQD